MTTWPARAAAASTTPNQATSRSPRTPWTATIQTTVPPKAPSLTAPTDPSRPGRVLEAYPGCLPVSRVLSRCDKPNPIAGRGRPRLSRGTRAGTAVRLAQLAFVHWHLCRAAGADVQHPGRQGAGPQHQHRRRAPASLHVGYGDAVRHRRDRGPGRGTAGPPPRGRG